MRSTRERAAVRAKSLVAWLAVLVLSGLALAACGGASEETKPAAQPGPGLIAFERDDGIYVAHPDGSDVRRLTSGRTDTAPRWAPGGRELAFLGKRDGQWDVYVVGPDGKGERRLTRTAAEELTAMWAPNGKRLALVTKRRGETVLELVRRTGGTPRVVATGVAEDDLPAWSPDSRRLGVVRKGAITIVDPATRSARELVRGTTPSWSPDGEWVAFTREGLVYVVAVDGSGERPLGPEGNLNVVPKFSPDGERIAFQTTSGARDPFSGLLGIAVTNSDGTDTKTLVGDAADFPPVWAPDGSSLLYIRALDEKGFMNYDVCAVRVADGRVTVIAGSDEPEYVGSAAWQPLTQPAS